MISDYLDEILKYNVRKAIPDPKKCALLVIDMQNYFCGIASPVLDNVARIIKECRSRNIEIIYTQHGHKDIEKDGGMLGKWWNDYISYGSKEWEIIDLIAPQKDDLIIEKKRYSAFYETQLEKHLKKYNIEELIITGVMTNCCCETTARDAFVRDFRVFFMSDATATVNDDLHISTLKNLAFAFAHVLSTRELLS